MRSKNLNMRKTGNRTNWELQSLIEFPYLNKYRKLKPMVHFAHSGLR